MEDLKSIAKMQTHNADYSEDATNTSEWRRLTPSSLSKELRKLRANLREVNVIVEFEDRSKAGRIISIRYRDDTDDGDDGDFLNSPLQTELDDIINKNL